MKRKDTSPQDEPFIEWLKKFFALILGIFLFLAGIFYQFISHWRDVEGYLLIGLAFLFIAIWFKTKNHSL